MGAFLSAASCSCVLRREHFICLRRAETADRAGNLPLRFANRVGKPRRAQGGRLLRGITKYPDRSRIFAETHRNRSEADRRTHSREGSHQATSGAALRGSATSPASNRKSASADQRKAGRPPQLRRTG